MESAFFAMYVVIAFAFDCVGASNASPLDYDPKCLSVLEQEGLNYQKFPDFNGYPRTCGWNQWRDARHFWKDLKLTAPPVPYTCEGEKSPIFVLGCGHTGTTWTINMLNRHPSIFAPDEETRIFNRVGQDLTVLVDRIEKRMKKHDKLRWAEKTPAHVCNIGKILNAFPCARIIFMIRDPRDVFISFSKRYSASYASKRIVSDHQAGFLFLPDPRIKVIRYEDLVLNTLETLREIFDHINEPFADHMLDTLTGAADVQDIEEKKKQLAQMIESNPNRNHDSIRRLQKHMPLYKDSVGRWKRDMTSDLLADWNQNSQLDQLLEILCYKK